VVTDQRSKAAVLVALWRMARPPIWLVSLAPLYIGNVLATRDLVPGWSFGLAMFVMGPLAWGAALCINDVHDLAGDRRNPRKSQAPLVRGAVSSAAARVAAHVFACSALIGAAVVGWWLAAATAAFLVLGWAYSVPPVRLKTRPGADVVTNALAVGGLALVAGWLVERPLPSFPWAFLPQGLLVAAALYIPTTLVDLEADARSEYPTVATRFGRHVAYEAGFAAWIAANIGAVALSLADHVIPRRMFVVLLLTAPTLVIAYHRLIGAARSPAALVRGIVVVSLLFLVPGTVFVLMYTGTWAAG
jgi:chlorophyll synthase